MVKKRQTLKQQVEWLKDQLRQVEWVQPMYNGSPSCSHCGNQQHIGHAPECIYETHPSLRSEE